MRLIVASILMAALMLQAADAPKHVLKHGRTHLRSGAEAEWDDFKGKPAGQKLEIHFQGHRNDAEQTLFIEQDNVKFEWPIRLNGTNLGKLFLMEAPLVWTVAVPPGALRDGVNLLTITPPKENDDIIVGRIELDFRPRTEALNEAALQIQVTENGAEVPCRITITRSDDCLAPMLAAPGQSLAFRPGVIYSRDGKASVELLAGKYVIYASRGPEYSLAKKQVKLKRGQRANVSVSITREVATPHLASCDTHIHTWTYSKHGDATLDERMLTLAGEGVELPVSTDHNLIIDYSSCARSNGVAQYFTTLTGCEVTTAKGHFNAFPIVPGSTVPDFKLEDWPALMQSIRATPGVQVLVLNHPTDTHDRFCPFAPTNFNAVTGENRRGPEFSFDAMELVNSGALRSDLMETFRDWFALLNYGYRVSGVGASDSHDVSRFIVGQGRTYIECDDKNPGAINVDEVCRNLRAGKALISLGLLTTMTVNERFGVGDLATTLGRTIDVSVEARGPSWMSVDRVELFANGTRIREERLRSDAKLSSVHLKWSIPRPLHDFYLVAIATGPGVSSPHWAIPRPYQPTSTSWNPRVLGATNPIWVDADGDGQFTPARKYAQQIVQNVGAGAANVIPALVNFDEAVATQAASLCTAKGKDIRDREFTDQLRRASRQIQAGFAAFEAADAPRP